MTTQESIRESFKKTKREVAVETDIQKLKHNFELGEMCIELSEILLGSGVSSQDEAELKECKEMAQELQDLMEARIAVLEANGTDGNNKGVTVH